MHTHALTAGGARRGQGAALEGGGADERGCGSDKHHEEERKQLHLCWGYLV